MSRRFIATVVAAAVTVAALGNGSARADEDLARALAAIVGAAIAGKVISDRLDDWGDDDRAPAVTRRHDDRIYDVRRALPRSDHDLRHFEAKPLPDRVKRRLLPGECLRSYRTVDGRSRIFGKKCLQENYAFNRSLPRACVVKFRSGGKTRRGYDARCLRREGYQLARS